MAPEGRRQGERSWRDPIAEDAREAIEFADKAQRTWETVPAIERGSRE